MNKSDYQAAYDTVVKQIKKTGSLPQESAGPEGAVWMCVEVAAAIFDGVMSAALGGPVGGLIGGGIRLIRDACGGGDPSAIPNPYFVFNGHEDNPIWYTRDYMKNRFKKNMASGGIALAGMGVSFVSQVDVGGILQHGNAVGSTGAHIFKFQQIAKCYKESRTIANWMGVILKMKAMKLGVRGAGLVGACIPVPAVGAVTGVLASATKLGASLSMRKVCCATAMELHWRGYQESVLTGMLAKKYGAGQGPAMRILRELFQRRGATRVFGQYDVDRIMREPNGWVAIQDKLTLI